jgi:hypothetical protein
MPCCCGTTLAVFGLRLEEEIAALVDAGKAVFAAGAQIRALHFSAPPALSAAGVECIDLGSGFD